MSGPRRRRGKPGKGFGKKTARTTFEFHSKHQEIDFLVSRAGNWSSAANGGKVLASSFSVVIYNTPFIVPSHLLRTSSYMNFFRIQGNFILFKYTHTFFFHFFLYFYFISFIFASYFFIISFFSCSGMSRKGMCLKVGWGLRDGDTGTCGRERRRRDTGKWHRGRKQNVPM